MKPMRMILPSLIAVLLLLFFSGCPGSREEASGTEEAAAERRAAVRRLENPEEVAALGKVIPEGEVLDLTFEQNGRIARIEAEEGKPVGAGDLLIALETELENNQLEALAAQLARNRLEQEDARAQRAYQEEVLEVQRQTYERLKRSVEARALPASELDPVELDMKKSRQLAADADRLLQRLEAQARELRIQQEEVRLRLRQKVLKAPSAGAVLRWEARTGETANAYQRVGRFAPGGPRLVEAEVDEYFAANVRVGQPAVIRREGYADTLARGTVIFTADNLSDKSVLSEDNSQFEDLQVRRIRIRLEEDGGLLLGMKVEALIYTGENQ